MTNGQHPNDNTFILAERKFHCRFGFDSVRFDSEKPIEMNYDSVMQLLLVEDDIEIQNFLRSSLQEAGYQVETAADGKTAERLAIDTPFDILIVDLGLPDMDGISLILRLRQME